MTTEKAPVRRPAPHGGRAGTRPVAGAEVAAHAEEAAREVLTRLGRGSAELRRDAAGSTSSVFVVDDVVVCVTPPGTTPHEAAERVALAGLLDGTGSCVRPSPPAAGPSAALGRVVLVWERVPTRPGPADPTALGRALRCWHEVGAEQARAVAPTLPDLDDLTDVGSGIAAAVETGRLARRDAAVLAAVLDRLAAELAADPGLGVGRGGLVHGDLHAGNVLPHVDGHVVLCDLDEVGTGHPDHDLGRLTEVARPMLRTAADRAAFEEGYGAPLPGVTRARALARLAHLRRTVDLVLRPEAGLRGSWFRRLRSTSWQDTLRDWDLELHPVVTQSRPHQIRRVLRPSVPLLGERSTR